MISAAFEVHKTYLFEARDREQAANTKIRSSKKLEPQPTLYKVPNAYMERRWIAGVWGGEPFILLKGRVPFW